MTPRQIITLYDNGQILVESFPDEAAALRRLDALHDYARRLDNTVPRLLQTTMLRRRDDGTWRVEHYR